MDYIESAKLELDRARQELAEAEWSGDHEAVLIWRRTEEAAHNALVDAYLGTPGY